MGVVNSAVLLDQFVEVISVGAVCETGLVLMLLLLRRLRFWLVLRWLVIVDQGQRLGLYNDLRLLAVFLLIIVKLFEPLHVLCMVCAFLLLYLCLLSLV